MKPRSVALVVAPGLALLLGGFAIPTIAMLLRPPGSATAGVFDQLGSMLSSGYYLRIIERTLWIGLIVTALCLVFGFPVAYLLARSRSKRSGLLLALAIFPLLVSDVVRTYGWLVALGQHGAIGKLLTGLGLVTTAPQLLYTPLAIVLGLTQLFLPLAIITCYSAISQVDRGLDDAARGLGASRLRGFWGIVVPLSLPGIVVAATIVFAGSITAYTTPYLLGGSRERMLSTELFDHASVTLDWTGASAIAVVMTILVFAVSAVSALAARKGKTS